MKLTFKKDKDYDSNGDELKLGDIVKMSEKFKRDMLKSESVEHIKEFGNCCGIIEEHSYGDKHPEVDVGWRTIINEKPCVFRYGYLPKNLTKIKYNS